jgi:hypothetical protein
MHLLIPGRHKVLTTFQFEYLRKILSKPLNRVLDINGLAISGSKRVSAVIFAVTSANHSNTRRNPLPFYIRALMIVKNRLEGKVELFSESNTQERLAYPVTNILMMAVKA